MPRKPKHQHPLRDIRRILGPHMTQKLMAAELDIAPITLTKIENRDRIELSADAIGRLAEKFAVMPSSFEDGNPLLDLFGQPYSKESAQLWRKFSAAINPKDVELVARHQAITLGSALMVAKENNRFMEAKVWLDDMLAGFIDEFVPLPGGDPNDENTPGTMDSPAFRKSARHLTARRFKLAGTVGQLYTEEGHNEGVPKRKRGWKDSDPVELDVYTWVEPSPLEIDLIAAAGTGHLPPSVWLAMYNISIDATLRVKDEAFKLPFILSQCHEVIKYLEESSAPEPVSPILTTRYWKSALGFYSFERDVTEEACDQTYLASIVPAVPDYDVGVIENHAAASSSPATSS